MQFIFLSSVLFEELHRCDCFFLCLQLEGQFMPLNNMNSTSKLKETTPVDQAKKSVEESALLLSLKATKTKKQQTLSEMLVTARESQE